MPCLPSCVSRQIGHQRRWESGSRQMEEHRLLIRHSGRQEVALPPVLGVLPAAADSRQCSVQDHPRRITTQDFMPENLFPGLCRSGERW